MHLTIEFKPVLWQLIWFIANQLSYYHSTNHFNAEKQLCWG